MVINMETQGLPMMTRKKEKCPNRASITINYGVKSPRRFTGMILNPWWREIMNVTHVTVSMSNGSVFSTFHDQLPSPMGHVITNISPNIVVAHLLDLIDIANVADYFSDICLHVIPIVVSSTNIWCRKSSRNLRESCTMKLKRQFLPQ